MVLDLVPKPATQSLVLVLGNPVLKPSGSSPFPSGEHPIELFYCGELTSFVPWIPEYKVTLDISSEPISPHVIDPMD